MNTQNGQEPAARVRQPWDDDYERISALIGNLMVATHQTAQRPEGVSIKQALDAERNAHMALLGAVIDLAKRASEVKR